jgi:hypothetical protein
MAGENLKWRKDSFTPFSADLVSNGTWATDKENVKTSQE